MQKLDLEIAIPTYNRASLLRSQLKALEEQQKTYDFAVTVFDNGSSDDTEATVRNYQGLRRLTYHRALVNGGISRNIMRCLEETSADWIWTLSDDNPVKEDDLAIIASAITSQRADIYTFKTMGNHINEQIICQTPLEFLSHQELLSLGYLSATVYSRRAIQAGQHLLAPAAYTLLPHCLLAIAAVGKGCKIEFNRQSLCKPEDAEKRISRKEFALGAVACLEFFTDEACQRILARQLRANTRWMLISALAQTSGAEDVHQWKRLCHVINSTLNQSGGHLWSCLLNRSWHAPADYRRELLLAVLPWLPTRLLLRIGQIVGHRSRQSKTIALFDNNI